MYTIVDSVSSDDDEIILVLGALAKNNNFTIQKVIVNELLQRLNAILSYGNIKAVTTIMYGLGNSGSKLAISPLLAILKHNDIDIQISAIRSLASHLDQPDVQEAVINLLSTDEDKILEEILKALIEAFENKVLVSPSKELLVAITNSAINLQNPNLYELFIKYLQQLKTNGIDVYLVLLKQQHNYGDLQNDQISDMNGNNSRVKRGSDWDQSHSDYDVVASYAQRRKDVVDYPDHRAYIWGKTFGVSKLNLKVGAGAFAGLHVTSTTIRSKFFAKLAAKVYVFGKTINVGEIESSHTTSGKIQSYKIYVKQGYHVDKSDIKQAEFGLNFKTTLSYSRRIFNERWPIFVYVGTVNVYIQGSLSSGVSIGLSASAKLLPPIAKASIDTKLSFGLRVSGGAYASLLVSYNT